MTDTRIRKFNETDEHGHRLVRIVYVTDLAALPPPHPNTQWIEDLLFDEAQELRDNHTLHIVFEAARADGYALLG